MTKPYIACHMMEAVDGRIDCAMTSKLQGVDSYYRTLAALACPTTLSGRVTAQVEMAEPGTFAPTAPAEPLGKEDAKQMIATAGSYEVVVDTKGTLLWRDQAGSAKPLLVVTSEQVSREYLAYLESKHISWIAAGAERIDLPRAVELLASEFGVERMAVVGGGAINAAFLAAGLLDEVSILLAPGIDGRGGMAASFDGLPAETEPFQLRLESADVNDDGSVWLRYALR